MSDSFDPHGNPATPEVESTSPARTSCSSRSGVGQWDSTINLPEARVFGVVMYHDFTNDPPREE